MAARLGIEQYESDQRKQKLQELHAQQEHDLVQQRAQKYQECQAQLVQQLNQNGPQEATPAKSRRSKLAAPPAGVPPMTRTSVPTPATADPAKPSAPRRPKAPPRTVPTRPQKAADIDSAEDCEEEDDGDEKPEYTTFSCGMCNQLDTDDMVACDGCRKWYHFECPSPPFDTRRYPEQTKWYCENCEFFRDPLSIEERPTKRRTTSSGGSRKKSKSAAS
jgi:hypothetical protein